MKLLRTLRRSTQTEGASAHIRQGDRCNQERNWPDAARHYRAALAIDPTRAGIWVQLGHACKEYGDLADAEAAYRRAAQLVPDDSDPLLHLGHLLAMRGKPAASIAVLSDAQTLLGDPDFASETIATQRAVMQTPIKQGKCPAWATPDIVTAWEGAGFALTALALFDPWVYWQLNPGVRAQFATCDATALILHFLQDGIEYALPFSLLERFDPAFYCKFFLNAMPFTPANAYRHWLEVGAARHVPPNERRWLQSLLGDDITTLHGVDPAMSCAFADVGVRRQTHRTIVEGFIDDCVRDPRRPIVINAGNASIFHAIASRAERAREDRVRTDAQRLRERIFLHVPEHRDNARALAHGLIEREADVAALPILRGLIDASAEPATTYGNLAQAENRLGLHETALATLRAGCARWPGDVALARAAHAQEEVCFHQAWAEAAAMARLGRVGDGQRHLTFWLDKLAADAAFSKRRTTALPGPRGTVAIVGKMNLAQCRLYRIDQRAEQLRTAGMIVHVFDADRDLDAYLTQAPAFGTVIFYRVPALPSIIRAIALSHAVGASVFYEIDDPIFDMAHFPEPFATYGGAIDQETHDGLALGAPLFARALRLCGQAIASTDFLAGLMAPLVEGKIVVVPNVMGEAHRYAIAAHSADLVPPDADKPITIFYGSNTKANRREIADILEPSLIEIIERYGTRVRLCVIGDLAEDSLLPGAGANVVLLPVIRDVQHYWTLLAQADINLAVLAPSVATKAKSGIKWLEAAMFGIPSVLSDLAPYRDVARPDETALFATSKTEWVRAIDRLIRDTALRHRIGDAARRDALAMSAPDHVLSYVDTVIAQDTKADERPRILVVNVFYPPQAIGGATRVVHDTVHALRHGAASPEFHIEVFATMEGASAHDITISVQDGVVVTSVGALEVDDKDAIVDDPAMVAIFQNTLDRFRPDAVHFHCVQRLTVGVVEAVRARAIPYAITTHDAWWISDHQFAIDTLGVERLYDYNQPLETLTQQGRDAFVRMERLRPALFGARAICAVSESFAALYRRCGVQHVMVIENGAPPLDPVARVAPSGRRIRLGFVGGLARHKGWDLIRIALSSGAFDGLELLAIDHAMPSGSERYDRIGQTTVLFRGKTAQENVAALYAQIDVLLAPSIWPESFGLVTREALACGCWLVASRCGAIGDVIEDGVNGHYVDIATPEDLARIFAMIQNDPARYGSPPDHPRSNIRTAADQAADTARLYRHLLSPDRSFLQ